MKVLARIRMSIRCHCLEGSGAQPASLGIFVQDGGGVLGGKEDSPFIEDGFKLSIDLVHQEDCMTTSRSHGPIKDGVDGEAHQAGFVERGCMRHDVVEKTKHLVVVLDLRLAARVLVVMNLLEHLLEEHEDGRVSLNELLKLGNHWMELLLLSFSLFESASIEPLFAEGMIRRKPVSDHVRPASANGANLFAIRSLLALLLEGDASRFLLVSGMVNKGFSLMTSCEVVKDTAAMNLHFRDCACRKNRLSPVL